MRRLLRLAVGASAIGAAACGYTPLLVSDAVPAGVERVYVETIPGIRGDPVLADALARELRRVVRRDGRFRVAADRAGADAVLRVALDSTLTRPVAFDEFDDPLDYETTISIAARLEGRDSRVLWQADQIAATRAHAAVAGAVVTSSSAFVSSERLKAADLAAFNTVQLGEERRVHAHRILAADLAATIYLRMMEGR